MKTIIKIYAVIALCALASFANAASPLLIEAAKYTFDDYTGIGYSGYTTASDFTYAQFNANPSIGVFQPTNGTFRVSGRNMWESGTLELNSQLEFIVTLTNLQKYVELQISEFAFDMSAVDGVPTVGEVYVSSVSDFSTQHKIGEFSTSDNGAPTTGTLTSATDDFTFIGLTMEDGQTLYFRIYFTDGYRNNATNAWLVVDNVIIRAWLVPPTSSVIMLE